MYVCAHALGITEELLLSVLSPEELLLSVLSPPQPPMYLSNTFKPRSLFVYIRMYYVFI